MSGGGERSEGEGARERRREGGGGEVGEAGGRKGGAPLRRSLGPANARRALSPELRGACERPFAAAAAAAVGGGGKEGVAAGGRRPPSKPPAKCSGLQKQAAGFAEQSARPGAERARGAARQRRGCWWAPVPSARGSGSPCPCGAGPPGTSGFPACPHLDALGLAAAGSQEFESRPREGSCLGRPRSGGPAANMLRKGELEPQGQVGVGCARGRAASPRAARELPGAGLRLGKQPLASWRALPGRTRRGLAAGAQPPLVAGCETRD